MKPTIVDQKLLQANASNRINLKIQSQTKTKRLREMPANFQELKTTVEALIKDERAKDAEVSNIRDYQIRYMDPDNEMINVSDDEDLLTAYDLAENGDLKGNLKLVVEFKN